MTDIVAYLGFFSANITLLAHIKFLLIYAYQPFRAFALLNLSRQKEVLILKKIKWQE
jgi:hypothetical protein